jgi:hypothetical protein
LTLHSHVRLLPIDSAGERTEWYSALKLIKIKKTWNINAAITLTVLSPSPMTMRVLRTISWLSRCNLSGADALCWHLLAEGVGSALLNTAVDSAPM